MTTKLEGSAVALSAFRALPSGTGRQYSATTFPKDPRGGCERFVRTLAFLGFIGGDEPYAVLDVLDRDGDIIQDFPIATAAAFRFVKRKLNLVVEQP